MPHGVRFERVIKGGDSGNRRIENRGYDDDNRDLNDSGQHPNFHDVFLTLDGSRHIDRAEKYHRANSYHRDKNVRNTSPALQISFSKTGKLGETVAT